MEHFEIQSLIFLYLVCPTSPKSNVIFLILFEIFYFYSYILCWFMVCNTFLLCLLHNSLILFFLEEIILSSLFAYFRNVNLKDWVCYYFYFIFKFFISNQIKPPNNSLKPQTRETDLHFMDRLHLIFLFCDFTLMTTLDPNPPNVDP
jgi:hypothetical protein